MALWKVVTQRTKIAITYVNLQTGKPFNCGDQHPDTDVDLILQWITTEADPGDVVLLDGRAVMNMMPAAAA